MRTGALLQASFWGRESVQCSNLELALPLDEPFPFLEGLSPVKASLGGATRGQCGAVSRGLGVWLGAGLVPGVPTPDRPSLVLPSLPRPRAKGLAE